MYDKIKVKKDSVQVHGVYPPAVPHIADMWESAYGGRVINNLLADNVIVNPVDDKPTMHYRVAYFDDMLKDMWISKRAMDMAVGMGYDTMEISRVHTGNLHKYKAVDLYFYNSDEE